MSAERILTYIARKGQSMGLKQGLYDSKAMLTPMPLYYPFLTLNLVREGFEWLVGRNGACTR